MYTVYFIGDPNSTTYKRRIMSGAQIKRSKTLRDIAFIFKGEHPELTVFERASYQYKNNLDRLQKWDL